MKGLFKAQRSLSVCYIVLSVGTFLYSLFFMTEYSDLFGLILSQNQEITKFHDVILQTFNRQIFTWALVAVVGVFVMICLQIPTRVPDRFALVVMAGLLAALIFGAVTALGNLRAISAYYQNLDFSWLYLEIVGDAEEYVPKLTTFHLGNVLYTVQIAVNCLFGAVLTASHFRFVQLKKKGAI